MDIPAGTHARVEANRRRYDQLVALTRRYAKEGRTEQVLQSAMVAAHFA